MNNKIDHLTAIIKVKAGTPPIMDTAGQIVMKLLSKHRIIHYNTACFIGMNNSVSPFPNVSGGNKLVYFSIASIKYGLSEIMAFSYVHALSHLNLTEPIFPSLSPIQTN